MATENRVLEAWRDPQRGGEAVTHTLTPTQRTDTVQLVVGPAAYLPVIFIPGIMGSNLKAKDKDKDKGDAVWLVNGKARAAWTSGLSFAGTRQRLLHPQRVDVDDRGKVAGWGATEERRRARGWGQVAAMSYGDFLVALEDELVADAVDPRGRQERLKTLADRFANADPSWGLQGPYVAPTIDELKNFTQWRMPVWAFGYNWLDSNAQAASKLGETIDKVIASYNTGSARCRQVILVTHSMGGLVARACSAAPEMAAKVAGVIHGVMPAQGAAVAYRRCKVGVASESVSTSAVLGINGQQVTAVFAQAPGALQLLPTHAYPKGWLRIVDESGSPLPQQPPGVDPYASIYLERNMWWGLINEAWLAPKDGRSIRWDEYRDALESARDFHTDVLRDNYHPNTWAFCGTGVPSFQSITWQLTQLPAESDAYSLEVLDKATFNQRTHGSIDETGLNDIRLDANWLLSLPKASNQSTGTGDGTVPWSSGLAPHAVGKVRQMGVFRGLEHEPAYAEKDPQVLTIYYLIKIAGNCPLPVAAAKAVRP